MTVWALSAHGMGTKKKLYGYCFDNVKNNLCSSQVIFLDVYGRTACGSVLIFILVWFGAMLQPTRQGHYSFFFPQNIYSALCFRRVDWIVRCICKCVYNAKLQIEIKTSSFLLSFLSFSAHILYMPSETSLVLFLPFLPGPLWSFYEIWFTSTQTVPSPMSSDRWVVGLWWLTILSLVDHLLSVVEKLQTQSLAGHRKRFFGWDVGVRLFSIIFVLVANV